MGCVMDQLQLQQRKACLNCPRCNSTNTKFCYYNNYSLSQPRHFCKTCKRYWTRGGTLRNVPVGGGCRKINKRLKRQHLPSSSASNPLPSTLSLVVDAPATSSLNHVSQMPTSTVQFERPNNLLTPLFYGLESFSSAGYKDLIHPQQFSSYLDMNANTDNDPADTFFSGYNVGQLIELHTFQNVANPQSPICLQHNGIATDAEAAGQYVTSNNQASQLLERLFASQTTQQQVSRAALANGDHHHQPGDQQTQRWNTVNNIQNGPVHPGDTGHNSSTYWSGHRNFTSWPPNHLANMDG